MKNKKKMAKQQKAIELFFQFYYYLLPVFFNLFLSFVYVFSVCFYLFLCFCICFFLVF